MKLLDVGNASNCESWQRIGRCQASCHVTFKRQRHTQLPSGSIDIIIINITIIMIHSTPSAQLSHYLGLGTTTHLNLSSLLSEATTSSIIIHIVCSIRIVQQPLCYIHANGKFYSYKTGATYQMTNYKGSLTAKHETSHWTSY